MIGLDQIRLDRWMDGKNKNDQKYNLIKKIQ